MLGKKEASEATVASCLGTAVAYTLFSETTRSLSFEEAYHYFSLAYLSATADTRGVHAKVLSFLLRELEAGGCFPSAMDTQIMTTTPASAANVRTEGRSHRSS